VLYLKIEGIRKAAGRVATALRESSFHCTMEKQVQIAGYCWNIAAVQVQLAQASFEVESVVPSEYSQPPTVCSTPYIAGNFFFVFAFF